jgi:hypothetical protein
VIAIEHAPWFTAEKEALGTWVESTREEQFMASKLPYQTPKWETLGTVHEMTLTKFNKIGPDSDQYSNAIPIVGSIKPI